MSQNLRSYTSAFSYQGADTPFQFWANTEEGVLPDVVLFLGAGQIGGITRRVAQNAPSGVVVVDGVPHWAADPSGEDIVPFSSQFIRAAHQKVLDVFGLKSAHVIAESQAAPGVLFLADAARAQVRNIALIRPLGFTVNAFGDSPESRLVTFKRRARQTFFQFLPSLLSDPGAITILTTLFHTGRYESSKEAFDNKYAGGVSFDATQMCRSVVREQLQKRGTFTVLLTEKDRMFPPGEVLATLEAAHIQGIKHVITPGFHASLALAISKPVMAAAVQDVRSTTAG